MLLAAGIAFFLDAVILLLFGEKQRGVPKIVDGVFNWDFRLIMPYDRIVVGVAAILCIAGFDVSVPDRALLERLRRQQHFLQFFAVPAQRQQRREFSLPLLPGPHGSPRICWKKPGFYRFCQALAVYIERPPLFRQNRESFRSDGHLRQSAVASIRCCSSGIRTWLRERVFFRVRLLPILP